MSWNLPNVGSGSSSINTSGFVNLSTNVTAGNATFTVPSSFNQDGQTFTFVRFIVNGVNQTASANSITVSVVGNTDVEALYGAFGF